MTLPRRMWQREGKPKIPYLRVCLISGVMGILGLETILLVEDSHRMPYMAAIPSMMTWAVLSRFVVGESYWRAFFVGLISPVIAPLAGFPLLIVGFGIILGVMVKYWYIAFPFGALTGLLIRAACSTRRSTTQGEPPQSISRGGQDLK